MGYQVECFCVTCICVFDMQCAGERRAEAFIRTARKDVNGLQACGVVLYGSTTAGPALPKRAKHRRST